MSDDATTPANGRSYLVLARKYRPQTFDDLIGQEHVVRTLKNAIEQNRVHHAYLFTGSRGLGKTSSARILAKALNCEQGPTAVPCGECAVCRQIASGRGAESYTLNEIDGASNRSVDDARELRRTIGQKTGARFHVIVIDEVHMLTSEAFNTLLKTLEEPPPHVKFVFATTEIQKVPETIISRCQRLDFRRIPASTIADYLLTVAEREDIRAEPEALKLIARIAEGGMRDSLSKLDQAIAFCGNEIGAADVERIFGILSRRNLLELIESFVQRDYSAALEVARRIHEEGLDVAQVLRDLIDLFRDVAVAGTCGANTPLVDAMEDDRERMGQIATQVGTDTTLFAVEILMEGLRRIRTTGFPRLALEMTFIKLCELQDLASLPELVTALQSGAPVPAAAAPAARPALGGGSGDGSTAKSAGGSSVASSAADSGGGRRKFADTFAANQKKNAVADRDSRRDRAPASPARPTPTAGAATATAPPPTPGAPQTAPAGNGHHQATPAPATPPAAPAPAAPATAPMSAPGSPGGASTGSRRKVGTEVLKQMKSGAPTGSRGPGVARQLREQDAVRRIVDAFEGEILRVEENEQ